MTPRLDTSPYEGLYPTMPVQAAGKRTDPPVSVPNALWTVSYSLVQCSIKPTHHIDPELQLQRCRRNFLQLIRLRHLECRHS